MEMFLWMLLVTAVTGIGSGVIGTAIATLFDSTSNRVISMSLSFAAGLMLSIICLDFLPHALEHDESILHTFLVILFVGIGAALVGILGRVVDIRAQKRAHCCALDDPLIADALNEEIRHEHMLQHDDLARHSNEETPAHSHTQIPLNKQTPAQLKIAGWVIAFAIAIHNLPAGMSIGNSFTSAVDINMVVSGIIVAVLLGLHSIPESMSMAIPFLKSGLSKPKTILIGAFIGAFIVIGAILGFMIGEADTLWTALSLAFASGAMLYVLFGEILPEAFLLFHSKKPAIMVIAGIAIGLLLTAL